MCGILCARHAHANFHGHAQTLPRNERAGERKGSNETVLEARTLVGTSSGTSYSWLPFILRCVQAIASYRGQFGKQYRQRVTNSRSARYSFGPFLPGSEYEGGLLKFVKLNKYMIIGSPFTPRLNIACRQIAEPSNRNRLVALVRSHA